MAAPSSNPTDSQNDSLEFGEHNCSTKGRPRRVAPTVRAEIMMKPVVLSIAGLDPSGGAGIVADIKTIAAFGCFPAVALTSITFQNTTGVFGGGFVRSFASNAAMSASHLLVCP